MQTAPKPPAWAEAVVRALLAPDRAESVSGDLLEEYREEKRPALGALGADAWYVRQAAGIFLRKYWACSLLLILGLVTNDLFNTFRDPTGGRYFNLVGRSLIAIFLTAGVYGGWVTGRARGGMAVAIGTYITAWTFMALWWTATFYPFAQVQQTNPYWIAAWHYSDAPGESFEHWIFWDNVGALILGGGWLLLLSTALGMIGGTIGKLGRQSRCLRPSP